MEPNSDQDGIANAELRKMLAALHAAGEQPFDRANPIPAIVNHSAEFFEHERKAVFAAEWICLGRTDEIADAGDFLTGEIAGVPVLVVRNAEGGIGGFVNACAHRFACLVPDATGNTKRFTCRYHAWTYDLKGDLIRAPHMEMKAGFVRSAHGLRALCTEIWEGFVYICLAPAPSETVAQALAPLRDNVVGRYDMAAYRTVLRETMVWNANWKNLIENFTESYHVPIAHKKTFAKHKKPLDDYVCGEDSDHYAWHRAPQAADSGAGAAHPDNTRLTGEWRRMMIDFCVFPCHLVTLMPDYLWWISVQPIAVDQFQATWGVAVPPEVLSDIAPEDFERWRADLLAYMNIANDEDKVLVEALHRGSASTILPAGTYHPIERNLWQFTRYLARVCGRQ